jgi:hypothetical protein
VELKVKMHINKETFLREVMAFKDLLQIENNIQVAAKHCGERT